IPRDFRGADDLAVGAFDGRDGQRNHDRATVLALTNGFIMLDTLASPNAVENHALFVMPFCWNENRYRLAHPFFRRIAAQPLPTLVPTRDDCTEVLADNRVITGLDDGRKPSGAFFAFAQCSFDLAAFNKVGGLSREHIQ